MTRQRRRKLRAAVDITIPGTQAVIRSPTQLVPGKRKPAPQRGDARPMIPRGGTTVIANASGARQTKCARSDVHAMVHGSESRIAELIQMAIAASNAFPPRYRSKPSTMGHRADT